MSDSIQPVTDPSELDPSDPSYGIYQSGLDAHNSLLDLQDQLQQLQEKVTLVCGMMATVSPMVACQFMVPYLMQLLGQGQAIQQVAIPSEQLDEQNAALQGFALQQSLYNQLSAGAQSYNNYYVSQNDEQGDLTNKDYVQGVDPMTPDQAAAYEQTMTEFNNCTACLTSVLNDSLDPNSGGYGWMDSATATTLLQNENTINGIMDPKNDDGSSKYSSQEDARHFSYQYSCYVANPTTPTNPNGDPVTDPTTGASNPGVSNDSYAVAGNVQILTQAFNTNISMMNSVTQTTTGKIKAGTSEVQQFEGSTESTGKAVNQLALSEVANEKTN